MEWHTLYLLHILLVYTMYLSMKVYCYCYNKMSLDTLEKCILFPTDFTSAEFR